MPESDEPIEESPERGREATEERIRYLEVLSRMQSAIAGRRSLDDTLDEVTDSARLLIGLEGAVVLLPDSDERAFVPRSSVGLDLDRTPKDAFSREEGIAADAVRTHHPAVMPDTSGEPDRRVAVLAGGERAGAAAAIPICQGDEVVGVLEAFRSRPAEFTDEEIAGLSVFADSIAVAIVNERTHAEMVRQRAHLEQVIETVPSGALIVEREDERITIANRKLGEFLGCDLPPGRSLLEAVSALGFVHPGGPEIPHDRLPVIRALRHGERVEGEETEIVRVDGSRVVTLANAAPLYDEQGEIYGAVAAFEDITAVKDAQRGIQQALDRERRISVLLQTALLPDVPERLGWLEMAGEYVASYAEDLMGGDFYDVFTPREGFAAIVIGDVSGKGVEGAVRTALAKYTLRAYAREDPTPASVIARTNDSICEELRAHFFITLFYGLIDLEKRTLAYTNAGHNPPLRITGADCRVLELTAGGVPLGIRRGWRYGEESTRLEPGDRLLLYTDGVTEARSPEGFFGEDALVSFAVENCRLSSREFASRLIERVQDFSRGRLHDDVAVLLLRAD